MNKAAAEYIIFMINAISDNYHQPPSVVYQKLRDSGMLKILASSYDIWHTISTPAAIEDIRAFQAREGLPL